MPKSYIGGFEKIKKRNNKNWDDDYNPKNNDRHKNKRTKKTSFPDDENSSHPYVEANEEYQDEY